MVQTLLKLKLSDLYVISDELKMELYIPGIQNPFTTLTPQGKTQLLIQSEDRLREGGIRIPGFGGRIRYEKNIHDHLAILTEYTYYIQLDLRYENSRVLVHNRYYFKDSQWYQLSIRDEDVELLKTDAAEIVNMCERIPEETSKQQCNLKLRKLDLKRISRFVDAGNIREAMKLLNDANSNAYSKSFLLDALSGKTGYAAIVLIKKTDNQLAGANSTVLFKDGNMAELFHEVAVDDRTMIGIRSVNEGEYSKLKETLKSWLTV